MSDNNPARGRLTQVGSKFRARVGLGARNYGYLVAYFVKTVRNLCRNGFQLAAGSVRIRIITRIAGHDRSQTLLLPESLNDYVDPENPVRFIEAFVDGLDLTTAGFIRVDPKRTGRPGYDPADLLKLYIYGYLNRVRSSRRLEAETHRNIEVIWLLRYLKA